MKKRKLPTSKKNLRSTGDQLWVLACVKRWGQRCGSCGALAGQVHHFFPKHQFGILRFEVENGVPICVKCHMGIHFSGDPRINESIIKNRGKKWYDKLVKASRAKFISYQTAGWYKEQIQKLRNYLES